MRSRFDQFSKAILADCLSEAGDVVTQRETSPEPQQIDVWFLPHKGKQQLAIHTRPVLEAVARHAALVEAFHQTPSTREILSCIGKQQSIHAELLRTDQKAPLPLLWIVSSGRPRTSMRELGFTMVPLSTKGVYTAPEGFGLRLVVISSLPKTRETLVLRLLGAGRTLIDALQELARLPPAAWEREIAVQHLIRYRMEIGTLALTERTPEEEAIMAAQDLYEQWEKEHEARGKTLGLKEGLEPLVRLYERRLGRALAESERAGLRDRLSTLGASRLGDVVLDLSSEELGAWLADPSAK